MRSYELHRINMKRVEAEDAAEREGEPTGPVSTPELVAARTAFWAQRGKERDARDKAYVVKVAERVAKLLQRRGVATKTEIVASAYRALASITFEDEKCCGFSCFVRYESRRGSPSPVEYGVSRGCGLGWVKDRESAIREDGLPDCGAIASFFLAQAAKHVASVESQRAAKYAFQAALARVTTALRGAGVGVWIGKPSGSRDAALVDAGPLFGGLQDDGFIPRHGRHSLSGWTVVAGPEGRPGRFNLVLAGLDLEDLAAALKAAGDAVRVRRAKAA